MVLLKIKLGCLNGNCYGLINYSRILYLVISWGRCVHCLRWKNCLSLGIAETTKCALNWFNTWLNQQRDLFEDNITLWHTKLWFYVQQSCNFSFSANCPSIRWALAPESKKVRHSLFPILKFAANWISKFPMYLYSSFFRSAKSALESSCCFCLQKKNLTGPILLTPPMKHKWRILRLLGYQVHYCIFWF